MEITNSRGSIWRKWDLHIHTPASIVQHYGEDNEETWEKYITDLLTCLQKNSCDIDVTVKETGVPKGLLIRILKDSLKYFFVSDNIKATIKSLLAGDNEDKKGSSIR